MTAPRLLTTAAGSLAIAVLFAIACSDDEGGGGSDGTGGGGAVGSGTGGGGAVGSGTGGGGAVGSGTGGGGAVGSGTGGGGAVGSGTGGGGAVGSGTGGGGAVGSGTGGETAAGGGTGSSTGGGSSVASKPADCTDVLASTVDSSGNPLITLVDAMNYSFSSSISATTTKVAANSDLTFDWSAITIDMLGHPFDPLTSVDMMQVVLWNVTQAEFLQGINDELLDTDDMVGAGVLATGNAISSARFLQVTGPGGSPVPEAELLSYVDPTVNSPAQNTYAVMVASGVVLGQGTKMLAFFEPDPNETNAAVQLTDASTTLEYQVDLVSLSPVGIPAGTGDVVLSWIDFNRLTTNAMGREWIPTKITDVMVGHYENLTLGDLQDQFLNLQTGLASRTWNYRITSGQQVNLSQLTDESGQPFTGIDNTGIWVVGLTCGSCRNPAPWFLSVLAPCS